VSPGVVASVKARLLNQARRLEEEFQLHLVRYVSERFLYRLGDSAVRNRCILKGAALLSIWMPDPHRATRDLDFRTSGANDEDTVRELVRTICAVPCPEDGLSFDTDSLTVTEIRAEDEYVGQRVRMTAYLGKARIRFQLDFGFGDAVTPRPEDREYPTLLPGLPQPRIRVYRREVSIAEKFQAMVTLGRRTSRMKDFHDIWALSSAFPFEGPALRQALIACFGQRETTWPGDPPDALRSSFYEDDRLLGAWRAYLASGAFTRTPPVAFQTIGERVRAFLGPPRESIVRDTEFDQHWNAGGPWRDLDAS
jgi:predicted nucleotidyltransferase component of viral defense system